MSNEITDDNKVKKMIDSLVEKAKKASEEYLKLDQEQVNNIVKISIKITSTNINLNDIKVSNNILNFSNIDKYFISSPLPFLLY